MTLTTSSAERILTEAAVQAIEGTMEDSLRVQLYRLAMTIVSEQLYRVETLYPGTIPTETLLLLQQIALLCSEDVSAEKLLGGFDAETGDKGSGESSLGGLQEGEPGPAD